MSDSVARLLGIIAECEARADKATKGPWQVGHPDKPWGGIESAENMDDWVIFPHEDDEGGRAEDWEFIADARTALPAAYAALRIAVVALDHISRHGSLGAFHCPEPGECSEKALAKALEAMERGN